MRLSSNLTAYTLLGCILVSSQARAQNPYDEPSPATPTPATVQPTVMDPPPDEEPGIPWVTVAPEVGYLYFPAAEITIEGYPLRIEPRNGFSIKVHLDLGGDGIGVNLAPLFAAERSGGLFGHFQAVGGELGLAFLFGGPVAYVGFGLGFRAAYIFGDNVMYGAELFGRVPLHFTVYLFDGLALVLEGAAMYGGTGIRAENLDIAGATGVIAGGGTPEDAAEQAIMGAVRFGAGFGFEALVGLRFP